MNAEEILNQLIERGVAFRVAGDRLRIEAPQGVLTEELQRTLREHKTALLTLVQAKAVADMTLDEFAQAGLTVRVWSEVLGSHVLFASDNAPDPAPTDSDLPVYRASELRKLALLDPEPQALRCLHEVKTIFKGDISDVQSRKP